MSLEMTNGKLELNNSVRTAESFVGEATTQTEISLVTSDYETPTSLSSQQSSSCSSSEDDFSDSESVIGRISRGVARLFYKERVDRATQTKKDPITSDTERLAFDVVFYALGKRSCNSGDNIVTCLRYNVSKMLDRYAITFNGMMSRLQLNQRTDLKLGFNQIAEVLFSSGGISWSRIIALFAFGARLSQYCNERNLSDLVYDVATNLAQYAIDKLTPFLREHGGWATLCEVFPKERDFESTLRKSLILTGVGLTAVATIIILNR